MAEVGYIRVSTVNQNDARQLAEIELQHTFKEKLSGKSIKRPKLQECLNFCRAGDTLHVHSMDRLARNLKDLQNIVDSLVKREVKVHFHKENLIFSGEDNSLSKLMLQIMGAVAEFERSLINERQKEGIKLAQEKGVRFGRKPVVDDEKLNQIVNLLNKGLNKKEISEKMRISRQTLYKALKDVKKIHQTKANLNN
ncbi:MAG: recombinase family protein [Desulfobacteraceae bacterium]|nr:recombinase family protein [Desulfobacteraceae bacterium]